MEHTTQHAINWFEIPVLNFDRATAFYETLRVAAEAHHKLRLTYTEHQGRASARRVRLRACICWSSVWTLAAWCETREAFRSFRVDLVGELQVLEVRFRDEPGKTLADLFRQVESTMSERDSSSDAQAALGRGERLRRPLESGRPSCAPSLHKLRGRLRSRRPAGPSRDRRRH